VGSGLVSKMLPSEREMAMGRCGWAREAFWLSITSMVGAGEGGLTFSMVMSRSRREDRSSEAFSEGWSEDIRGVGVDGGEGERSSMSGLGRGGGVGLGWGGPAATLGSGGRGSWRTAAAGTGMVMMLGSTVGASGAVPSVLSCWKSKGDTGDSQWWEGMCCGGAHSVSFSYSSSLQRRLRLGHWQRPCGLRWRICGWFLL